MILRISPCCGALLVPLTGMQGHDVAADGLTKSIPASALVCHREIMMGHQKFVPSYA
jgi:hypothetical protein